MTGSRRGARGRVRPAALSALAASALLVLSGCTAGLGTTTLPQGRYPWHTNIVSTTFWVGEVFDPDASDGSQRISAYDSDWLGSYGGCDGIVKNGDCTTERRVASSDYFPTSMQPAENPFYLDLPVDDINEQSVFGDRASIIPWAGETPGHSADPDYSMMKNRWVELVKDGRHCFGQIEDAGPALYDDVHYVFGTNDPRPANTEYNGAGLDVSPALNGCLGYAELDGESDHVAWRFVDRTDVPAGPWTRIETTSQVR